ATARSAKRATRAQWDALLPVVDRSPMQTVDGFDIPVTATPVGSGESFGLRWMATVDRPVIPEESKEELAAVNLGLVLIDAQGRQGSFSWGDPAQVTSANGQIGKYFVIGARLPSGTTDFKIERNGKPLPYEHVALPDWERELYFTIIPAKDVDPVHVGVLTATLPDGRPYVAVR
ncbi:MAG TPA: hypothetical protein VL068_05945, partial [Microthrixaceae bacterium]|nr:hypothetical protein [Microthrixaceae bacterium]